MAGKAIDGEKGIKLLHVAVSRDLGKNTRGRDAQAAGITLHQIAGGEGKPGHRQTINEAAIHPAGRGRGKPLCCTAHGQVCGTQNVETVYFFHTGRGYTFADAGI